MGYTDIKLYALNSLALFVSLTDLEPILKIILLMLSIGYTAIRIYSYFEDKNKNKNK
jgi:hypothetical protein